MTPAGSPNADSAPGEGARTWADEFRAAFRRLAPQGTLGWNFAAAFARLEAAFGRRPEPSEPAEPPDSGPSPEPSRPPVSRRAAQHYLRPLVDEWSGAVTEAATAPLVEGLADTVEAFRFLAARVERLEAEAGRRREPADGLWQLVAPPDLGALAPPVVGWLTTAAVPGPVLHAESGDGWLLEALAQAGLDACGSDPRADAVASALGGGHRVSLESATDLLAGREPGSLGAVVLSGVVERLEVAGLAELVDLAVGRLAPGGALVVVSSGPGVPAEGWPAVARDLLPGRPLHPETWELLLGRAGLEDRQILRALGHLGRPEDPYAVGGRRP